MSKFLYIENEKACHLLIDPMYAFMSVLYNESFYQDMTIDYLINRGILDLHFTPEDLHERKCTIYPGFQRKMKF
jgi:hypothetical protein